MGKVNHKIVWATYLVIGGLFGLMIGGTGFMMIGLATAICLAFNF